MRLSQGPVRRYAVPWFALLDLRFFFVSCSTVLKPSVYLYRATADDLCDSFSSVNAQGAALFVILLENCSLLLSVFDPASRNYLYKVLQRQLSDLKRPPCLNIFLVLVSLSGEDRCTKFPEPRPSHVPKMVDASPLHTFYSDNYSNFYGILKGSWITRSVLDLIWWRTVTSWATR